MLPHWPKDRHLELAPKYSLKTRARLDPDQLEAELGLLDVPTAGVKPAASDAQS